MKFSLIVPVYNAQRYLPEMLNSVYMQSYDDFELILVDDGSTDETGVLIEAYASTHENTSAFSGQNGGPLVARRKGLSHCAGEYVLFIDSDDCLRRDALETIANVIDRYKPDIISFGYSRIPTFDSSKGGVSYYPKGFYQGAAMSVIRALTCSGAYNSLWNKVIRRECFDFEEDYTTYKGLRHGEDLLQLLPVLHKADSLVALDDILYYYRPNDEASTSRYRESQLLAVPRVCERVMEYAQKWGAASMTNACIGEAVQYLGLVQLAVINESDISTMIRHLSDVREVMLENGVFERADSVRLRLDRALELKLLKARRFRALMALVGVLNRMKNFFTR